MECRGHRGHPAPISPLQRTGGRIFADWPLDALRRAVRCGRICRAMIGVETQGTRVGDIYIYRLCLAFLPRFLGGPRNILPSGGRSDITSTVGLPISRIRPAISSRHVSGSAATTKDRVWSWSGKVRDRKPALTQRKLQPSDLARGSVFMPKPVRRPGSGRRAVGQNACGPGCVSADRVTELEDCRAKRLSTTRPSLAAAAEHPCSSGTAARSRV